MIKIHTCLNCSGEAEEINGEMFMIDTNEEGWWCDGCDAYNYFDAAKHDNHRFTIIYEDKTKQEATTVQQSQWKFKKQLSPFRYPGGKSKVIPFLASFMREEKCETLASPFTGGGSFELAMLDSGFAKRLKLNDLDYGVYAVWWAILNFPHELIHRIQSFKPSHEAFFEAQAHIKNSYVKLDLIDAAWATLLVNRFAFSGIAKANPLGGKNGELKAFTARWNPDTLSKRILAIHEMRDLIELFCIDAVEFIEEEFWSHTTTLFIDPPYFEKGKDLYNCYYSERDHVKLAVVLESLHIGTPAADILVTYDYNKWLQQIFVGRDHELVIGRNYSI